MEMDSNPITKPSKKGAIRPRRKFQSRGNLLLSPYNITHLHCIIHISPMECCYMHVN